MLKIYVVPCFKLLLEILYNIFFFLHVTFSATFIKYSAKCKTVMKTSRPVRNLKIFTVSVSVFCWRSRSWSRNNLVSVSYFLNWSRNRIFLLFDVVMMIYCFLHHKQFSLQNEIESLLLPRKIFE